jgi:hypothetical protein
MSYGEGQVPLNTPHPRDVASIDYDEWLKSQIVGEVLDKIDFGMIREVGELETRANAAERLAQLLKQAESLSSDLERKSEDLLAKATEDTSSVYQNDKSVRCQIEEFRATYERDNSRRETYSEWVNRLALLVNEQLNGSIENLKLLA